MFRTTRVPKIIAATLCGVVVLTVALATVLSPYRVNLRRTERMVSHNPPLVDMIARGVGADQIATAMDRETLSLNDIRDSFGKGLLSVAISWGRKDVVLLLLARGADVDDPLGRLPPLSAAVIYKEAEIAKILLSHGASPDLRVGGHPSPREEAVKSADPKIKSVFEQLDAPNGRDGTLKGGR